MSLSLKKQHETDREFQEWVRDHELSTLALWLALAYFTLAGIFPWGGIEYSSAIVPISIVAAGTTYSYINSK